MSNPVVVIGSNSFSGANFCKFLLEQGCEVLAISRSAEPADALLPYKWVRGQKLAFHQLDINHHLSEIDNLLDKLRPEYVYNFAAQSMVGQSWDNPEDWFMTNAVSSIKFHNILRHKDYLVKYIHISTPEVYGSCEGLVSEEHIFNPSTPYAVSRAAADMSLKTFFDVHKFPVVTTRAANVFGEGQQLYRIVPKTIMSVLKGETLPLHGGGHSTRSFIHMDDVSDATLRIGQQGKVGSCYHISTSKVVSIRSLVSKICELLDADFSALCDITDDRPGKDAAYLLDSSKLRNELGWQDKVSLEDGLERTIDWAQANFDTLVQQPQTYIHKA